MAKEQMNPKVDFFFEKEKVRQKELEQLRVIILECGLAEQLKWGVPCYFFKEDKIVLIHAFKEYCAVLFFKGALLHDEKKILVQQTKNVQSARQIRFTSLPEVIKMKATLKSYIYESIEIEKAGLKVKMKKTEEFDMPEEFQKKLDKTASLKKAFNALTPGRQRGYLLYFAAAKRQKTRESRIQKYLPLIMQGKGLNDQ